MFNKFNFNKSNEGEQLTFDEFLFDRNFDQYKYDKNIQDKKFIEERTKRTNMSEQEKQEQKTKLDLHRGYVSGGMVPTQYTQQSQDLYNQQQPQYGPVEQFYTEEQQYVPQQYAPVEQSVYEFQQQQPTNTTTYGIPPIPQTTTYGIQPQNAQQPPVQQQDNRQSYSTKLSNGISATMTGNRVEVTIEDYEKILHNPQIRTPLIINGIALALPLIIMCILFIFNWIINLATEKNYKAKFSLFMLSFGVIAVGVALSYDYFTIKSLIGKDFNISGPS